MRRTLALTLSLSLLASVSVRAQESTTRGFNLGAHLQGSSLTVDDERSNAGGGGIWLGYGFNRTVQLFLQLDGAEFDVDDASVSGDWTMGHADLGVRFHFANSLRSWVPYLESALTWRAVRVQDAFIDGTSEPDDVSLLGAGLTLGGGLLVYFNETFGLDLQLAWTGGSFNQLEVGNVTVTGFDLDAQSARFNVGISWWP